MYDVIYIVRKPYTLPALLPHMRLLFGISFVVDRFHAFGQEYFNRTISCHIGNQELQTFHNIRITCYVSNKTLKIKFIFVIVGVNYTVSTFSHQLYLFNYAYFAYSIRFKALVIVSKGSVCSCRRSGSRHGFEIPYIVAFCGAYLSLSSSSWYCLCKFPIL